MTPARRRETEKKHDDPENDQPELMRHAAGDHQLCAPRRCGAPLPSLKPTTTGFELSGFSWSFRLTLRLYARSALGSRREPLSEQDQFARILKALLLA